MLPVCRLKNVLHQSPEYLRDRDAQAVGEPYPTTLGAWAIGRSPPEIRTKEKVSKTRAFTFFSHTTKISLFDFSKTFSGVIIRERPKTFEKPREIEAAAARTHKHHEPWEIISYWPRRVSRARAGFRKG